MPDSTVATTADRTVTNRRRAEKRREVARAIRETRERLASSTGTRPSFDHELTLDYASNRYGAWLPMTVFTLLVAAIGWRWLDQRMLVVWAVIVLCVLAVQALACRRFTQADVEAPELPVWQRRFVIGELASGLIWSFLFVIPVANHGSEQVFLFGAALIGIAMSAMVSNKIPAAVVAGTLPIAALGAVGFLRGGDLVSFALAGFICLAEAFFLVLGGQLHKTSIVMLEFRAEKDALIAELEQANAVSDESRRRAEEANLAKSRFLATMSHELRTPLNAIIGFSEIMKGELFGPVGAAQYREYVKDIHGSGQHLLNLINEILDLSRIEAGKYELNEEAVTLAHIAEDCLNLMRLKASAKTITLTVHAEPTLPKLWADERAVRQVILNLLSNAVKFTQAGGTIDIKMGWTKGGGQYVSVRDNGPGIPAEEIPIVLAAFGQGSVAIKSAEAGTGLGLPIVQSLVHLHDGTFDLRSKLRVGTEVLVTFPSSRVLEIMPPIREEQRAG
jgi:two-component system cell cycle sensor histidine kinase PleC